ncbi:MAG: DUF2505 family protein [Moraxellaceae bacterium]
MTHKFQIQHDVSEFSLDNFRTALANPAFHAELAEKLPGTKVVISRSECIDNEYYMQRELNLEANIPKLAQKFLKDALRIKRVENWNLNTMTVELTFVLNMPAEFRCRGSIVQQGQQMLFKQDWEVDVRIPLIHGVLSRHAEEEIRRFNTIESEIFQQLLKKYG